VRIALIAAGALPVPPRDWGAVEGTIWYRKLYLERLGHHVEVFNTRAIHEVIHRINRERFDFAHCHSELFAGACADHLEVPWAFTSHFGGMYQFVPDRWDRHPAFNYLFRDTLRAPAGFVLCEWARDLYLAAGYQGFLRVLPNAVETDQFRLAAGGNGRAICVGRVCARKRQVWLAEMVRGRVPVDFVGPKDGGPGGALVEHPNARYLGLWNKKTLYQRLTESSCLVLLSASEGAPKVVLEGLAAGLSVVVTRACAANLTEQPFITVLPDEEDRPEVIAAAIQAAIEHNPRDRADIRAYARERFDYAPLVRQYLGIIEELLQQHGTGADDPGPPPARDRAAVPRPPGPGPANPDRPPAAAWPPRRDSPGRVDGSR
jgi:glycosyltransferase involved in cell wall biosynthesis